MTIPAVADQLAGLEAHMAAAWAVWAAASADERQAYSDLFAASARADEAAEVITTTIATWRRLRVQVPGYQASEAERADLAAFAELGRQAAARDAAAVAMAAEHDG